MSEEEALISQFVFLKLPLLRLIISPALRGGAGQRVFKMEIRPNKLLIIISKLFEYTGSVTVTNKLNQFLNTFRIFYI